MFNNKLIDDFKYSEKDVNSKSKFIFDNIISKSNHITSSNFDKMSIKDLINAFYLYDEVFFDNFFRDNYKDKLSFKLSMKMTKAGGKTSYKKNESYFIISISAILLFQTFKDIKRKIFVNGIECKNRLEAFQRILEHEIIHVLELIIYGDTSCKANRFKTITYNIFKHTDVTHQLITNTEIAYKKYDIAVNDHVTFEHEGKTYNGIISNIKKRATVLINDANGYLTDNKGNKFVKCYVPLSLLKRKKGNINISNEDIYKHVISYLQIGNCNEKLIQYSGRHKIKTDLPFRIYVNYKEKNDPLIFLLILCLDESILNKEGSLSIAKTAPNHITHFTFCVFPEEALRWNKFREINQQLQNERVGVLLFSENDVYVLHNLESYFDPPDFRVKEYFPDIKIEANKIELIGDRIGRNDPCPCGSGKKYKKCCLNK